MNHLKGFGEEKHLNPVFQFRLDADYFALVNYYLLFVADLPFNFEQKEEMTRLDVALPFHEFTDLPILRNH